MAVLIVIVSVFVCVLQKWRKTIKESINRIEPTLQRRRKERTMFLIDVFTLGGMGMVVVLLYLLFRI